MVAIRSVGVGAPGFINVLNIEVPFGKWGHHSGSAVTEGCVDGCDSG